MSLDCALLAAAIATVLYLYNLGLLQMMLYLFPRFDNIGLIGFILVPIIVVFMLIWGVFCAVVTCSLLLFALGLAVALVIVMVDLLRNLFAGPEGARDPFDLLRERLLGIWRGSVRMILRRP